MNHEDIMDNTFLNALYPQMKAFARSQLDDEAKADDAVQEALAAAFHRLDQFKGEAMLKTWVFAILKNKITDVIRKERRYVRFAEVASSNDDEERDELVQSLFDDAGHWYKHGAPQAFDSSWNNPEQRVHGESFWQVMQHCLDHLPPQQARVFLMREYVELETQEICDEVGISTKNFYVLMHRARLQLQLCLSSNWFEGASA